MMRNRIVSYIILLLLCSCGGQKKSFRTYATDSKILTLNFNNGKFHYIDKRHNYFYSYSEGVFARKGETIVLNTYIFDSCISYNVRYDEAVGRLKLNWTNYDPRYKIIYKIGGKEYESKDNKPLEIDLEKLEFPLNISIKVAFPQRFNYSNCYKRHESLYSELIFENSGLTKKGLVVDFELKYDYFNWISLNDTFEIVSKKRLLSKKNNFLYRLRKDSIGVDGNNYMNSCLMFYYPGSTNILKDGKYLK